MGRITKARILGLLSIAGALPLAGAPVPGILFVDVTSGPVTGGPGNLGAPISIFGKNFGAAQGSSKVTIGGVEVAGYLAWGQNNANNPWLDMITVQPGPRVTGGKIVVTVDGAASHGDAEFQKSNAKVLYVAPSGSDAGGCSEAKPCQTVLAALGSANSRAGDLILVRGGSYGEGEMWIRDLLGMSGTATRRKTVKAYPGEAPVFTNGARGVSIEANYLTISGLHFRNGKSMGVTDDYGDKTHIGRGVWMMNNTVIGPISYEGIGTHGSDHVVAGNTVRVERSSQGTQGHCLYVSHGDNVKILYNALEGAPGYGIHLFDQVRQKNDYRRTITNFLIEGNVLTGSRERAGLLMSMEDGGEWGTYGNYLENVVVRNNIFAKNNHHGLVLGGLSRGVKIYHNTFYENGRQGIYVGDHAALTGTEIRNNLIYQSANNGFCKVSCEWYQDAHIQDALGTSSRVIIDNNGYFPGPRRIVKGAGSRVSVIEADAHAVTGTAGFRQGASANYTLAAGSAAIDKGAPLPLVLRDFNGGVRPAGAASDLGAYEFGSGGGAPGTLPVITARPPREEAPLPRVVIPTKNVKPTGALQEMTNTGVATGWASDANDPDKPVKLHIYIDKNAEMPGAAPVEALARAARTEGHGFNYVIPDLYRDGKPHRIWVWAQDLTVPADRALLAGSPLSFKLAANGPRPVPECADGPIKKPCLCAGEVRTDNFCCNGNWQSYDACRPGAR